MYKKLIYFLVMAALLTACAAPSSRNEQSAPGFAYGAPAYDAAPAAPREYDSSSGKASYSSAVQEQRIVIKNADLVMVVDNPAQSLQAITRMAEDMGGFVVSANMYHRTLNSGVEVPEVSVTIRVPAVRLDEAIQLIEGEGSRPAVSKNINSQDVTSNYIDLKSRLRNLEAAEDQLQAIMNDARRTEEVLQVYNELTRVREQIEVIKGQIQYYDQASALSSISIKLMADEAVQPLTIAGWEPAGVARSAIQALLDAMQVAANAGIWTVLFLLPLLAVLITPLVVLILTVRALLRRRKRTPLPPPAAA
jgi:hypothetical protein